MQYETAHCQDWDEPFQHLPWGRQQQLQQQRVHLPRLYQEGPTERVRLSLKIYIYLCEGAKFLEGNQLSAAAVTPAHLSDPSALYSPYTDIDAESQNFLPEHNLGKKKYETEYVRASPVI